MSQKKKKRGVLEIETRIEFFKLRSERFCLFSAIEKFINFSKLISFYVSLELNKQKKTRFEKCHDEKHFFFCTKTIIQGKQFIRRADITFTSDNTKINLSTFFFKK